jgi:hypothetical protein
VLQRFLEQDQLCSLAMVANFKATRLFLNELWRSGLIELQVCRPFSGPWAPGCRGEHGPGCGGRR